MDEQSQGAGGSDFWVIKLDSNGAIQWQKAYGGASDDDANTVRQTSDGGYIVAGDTQNFGRGFLVLKLDSFGDVSWQKVYKTNLEVINDGRAVETSDGGYFVAGGNYGDFWIYKTDSAGNVEDCDLIVDTAVTVTTTNATVQQTDSEIYGVDISVATRTPTVTDTDCSIRRYCLEAVPAAKTIGVVLLTISVLGLGAVVLVRKKRSVGTT